MIELVGAGIVIGVAATVLMDLWALTLHLALGEPRPNWALPGRWFHQLAKGKVFHDSIAAAEPYKHEQALGWSGHYAVGIIYGIVFALMMGPGWFAAPTFMPAWIWGMVTIAAGWFFMQPGMGLGWAASKTPKPNKVRLFSILGHTVFALGLWGTALVIG